jgi:anti-sigma-K factor RskA
LNLEINEIISSGLLELYVAGLAADAEREQVEQWAASYPEVRAELAAIEVALENYAVANAVQPAAGVKARVMADIASPIAAAPPVKAIIGNDAAGVQKPAVRMWKLMAAASVALLIGSAIVGLSLYNKNKAYQKELVALKTDVNNKQAVISFQKQEYMLHHHDMEIMMEQGATAVELHKADGAPGECGARVFWSKKTGDVYIDPCRMINTPAGKQYQLWVMVNGKMISAGTINTAAVKDKYSIQKMKTTFPKAELFAVTLEKEGGSETPTPGQTYVTGKVV